MEKILISAIFFVSIATTAQNVKEKSIRETLSTLADDKMKGRKIGTPENDATANFIAEKFKANGLDYCVGSSYLVPFQFEDKTVYNVCGIKKGKSEKSLAFTAHFDHIGFNDDKNDSIFNGADDNASGTTAVIALSEYFKNLKPEFSMVFIGFNGEESGMKGSQAIANNDNLKSINSNIQALFNFEMIATESQYGPNALYMTGKEYSDLGDLLNTFSANDIRFHSDPYIGQNLFYRSDNVSYVKHKIIAHSFSTVDMTKAHHYHQVSDDISVVNFKNLTTLVNNFAKTVQKLTPQNFQPKYNDKVEFN